MNGTFLEKIVATTREKVERARYVNGLDSLRSRAFDVRSSNETHAVRRALTKKGHTNIIAEIKRASPSKGVINSQIDVAQLAQQYEAGGAAAISVLTEPEYFLGSLDDLIVARAAVRLPILRKDFIVDESQIFEAAAAGADAILLIVAALEPSELKYLLALTENELNMDALVEVHTAEELQTAVTLGARMIGINNRDLHSLKVSLDVSRRLIAGRPADTLMVAESGISGRGEIDELKELGFDAFLIGETLMRTANVTQTLGGWV